jgi:hypothetical protein
MVVHACNSSIEGLRQEDYKFKANLGYKERHSLKRKRKEGNKSKETQLPCHNIQLAHEKHVA